MKTTRADFERFQKLCREYQRQFGLVGIRLDFRHEDLGDTNANVESSWLDKTALVKLSTDTDRPVRDLACHEMLHLLLSEMAHHARDRFTSALDIDAAEERVVRTLEEVILDK